MGNSFSNQLEWNASSKETLQISVTNQDLLYDLNNMIEQLCNNFTAEAKAEFRMPIVWTSRVLPTAFANSNLWTIKEASKNQKASVSSVALRADGQPLFHMEQMPGSDIIVYKAKVANFEYLYKFLQVANEQKLTELQQMAQGIGD
jgi:hypothetical protein